MRGKRSGVDADTSETPRFLVALNLAHEPQTLSLQELSGTIVLSTDFAGIGDEVTSQISLSGNRGLIARLR